MSTALIVVIVVVVLAVVALLFTLPRLRETARILRRKAEGVALMAAYSGDSIFRSSVARLASNSSEG